MQREDDKDRAEKTPLIHAIVKDIIRGNVSPLKSQDGGVRHVMRDLYHLDLRTLKFLHQTHLAIEEENGS
jgi:hypothetical protein